MKIKITRPNGTVIEAEGTVEEWEQLLAAESGAPPPISASTPSPYPVWLVPPPPWNYPGGPVWTAPVLPSLPWDVTITRAGAS